MSEQIPSGKPDQAGGNDPEKKDSVAYESYQKLLAEKKKLQSEHQDAKNKLEEYEQGKLEAEGKLKEALENSKQLNAKLKLDKAQMIKNVAEKAIRSQVFRKAEKLGSNDLEMTMMALKLDDLEITDDFEFDEKKLDEKLQALTKEKPFLFKKDFQLAPDLIPSGSNVPAKALSDLSEAELKHLLRTAK